jgi:predicted Rossmann fold flavoprotein
MARTFDTIILGAGGAGLMCAGVAVQNGAKVLVIDHAKKPGQKILISGGGRCNFTNSECAPDRFLSANPHFAKSALGRYTAADFVAMVERHGIAYHEKTLGQLFCDGSARQIVDMLMAEAEGAEFAFGAPVEHVDREGEIFRVCYGEEVVEAANLVIATGGPSIPKIGASDFAYHLARQFGLKIVEPRPALVPFTLPGTEALFRDLSGVAAPTIVRVGKAQFAEASLFTHRGLSGPAMLQVSSYWRHGEPVLVDFLPGGFDLLAAKRSAPQKTLHAALSQHLPQRLADALVQRLEFEKPLGEITDQQLQDAQMRLHAWPFLPNGTEGFAKAEVTVGGVSTAELSSKTMEAKRAPGLYFIGEAVDVTGWLGGYNFQWAWSSGWAAGHAVAGAVARAA